MLVMLSGITLVSCGNRGTNHSSDSVDSAQNLNRTKFDTSSSSMNTAQLLVSLYSSGIYDLKASQEVQQKATDAHIRKAAAAIGQAQSKLNQEVSRLADEKQVSLPAAMSADQQQKLNSMLSGQAADIGAQYIRQMVYDHKDVLVILNQGIQSNDKDIVNWVTHTVPTVQSMLDRATSAQSYLDSLPRGRKTAQ